MRLFKGVWCVLLKFVGEKLSVALCSPSVATSKI